MLRIVKEPKLIKSINKSAYSEKEKKDRKIRNEDKNANRAMSITCDAREEKGN